MGARWLNYHFEHFLKREDLVAIKAAGATHVRVPIPHWMLEEPRADEPWIAGDRWKYFVRMAKWCREIGLEVWPDLHTAPGNQNGFDNCGQFMAIPTCDGWAYNPENVKRTVKVVSDIAHAIKRYGIDDVVTGFGLLNEPFRGCNQQVRKNERNHFNRSSFSIAGGRNEFLKSFAFVVEICVVVCNSHACLSVELMNQSHYYLPLQVIRRYYEDGLQAVRNVLGKKMAIYLGDVFEADKFNNGFWQDSSKYENTFLDSHYYHVFAEHPRSLSPRGHIAFGTLPKCEKQAVSFVQFQILV